jgi:hypothetical protein
MAEYNTPADYAASTRIWREKFDPDNYLSYDAQVKEANEWIKRIAEEEPKLHDEFWRACKVYGPGGKGWTPQDWTRQREEEAAEREAPVSPALSGDRHDNGSYIVLDMSTANGVLEEAMAHAFGTGDVTFGYIIDAKSKGKWLYEITCVDYDANALTPAAFLAKVTKEAPTEFKVNSEFVTNSQATRIAYRKKGTCNVSFVFEGDTDVSESDSPQYNDGKERVSAHYKG